MNSAPPPSSFDNDRDFYEESRIEKLRRRLVEEPLIPLGCAATVWALYEATKSMKAGDHYRTNRMFRRRIYAQGFTLVAMVAGSVYWESDRSKRKQYDGLLEEKKRKEKNQAWIRELEARDAEDEQLRKMRDRMIKGRGAEEKGLTESQADAVEKDIRADSRPVIRSVLEECERRRDGESRILSAAMSLWRSS